MSNQTPQWAAALIAADRSINELEAKARNEEDRQKTDAQREVEFWECLRRLPCGHQDHLLP